MSRRPRSSDLAGRLERATPAERRDLLRRALGSEGDLAALAGRDESKLFALLALEPVPAGMLDRLARNVDVALDESQAHPHTAVRGRSAFMSLAASLLLAGMFGAYVWMGRPAVAPLEQPVPVVGIQPVAPEAAEVVSFTVGETQVIMIFDEALDI